MKLLGKTEFDGKQYEITDVKGFVSNESKGLPGGFYGGRVTQLAKTDVKGMYLCMEKMNVIDIMLLEEDPLADLTNKELVALLVEKGIEVPKKYTKPDLLALLEG